MDVSDIDLTDDDKIDDDAETAVQFTRESAEPENTDTEASKTKIDTSKHSKETDKSISSLKKNLSTLTSFIQNLIVFFTFSKLKKINCHIFSFLGTTFSFLGIKILLYFRYELSSLAASTLIFFSYS